MKCRKPPTWKLNSNAAQSSKKKCSPLPERIPKTLLCKHHEILIQHTCIFPIYNSILNLRYLADKKAREILPKTVIDASVLHVILQSLWNLNEINTDCRENYLTHWQSSLFNPPKLWLQLFVVMEKAADCRPWLYIVSVWIFPETSAHLMLESLHICQGFHYIMTRGQMIGEHAA